MNSPTQSVCILEAHETAVPESIVIRRTGPGEYLIEERQVQVRISTQSTLLVESPLGSSIGGKPATGKVEMDTYRFKSKLGQWVVLRARDGQLLAE